MSNRVPYRPKSYLKSKEEFFVTNESVELSSLVLGDRIMLEPVTKKLNTNQKGKGLHYLFNTNKDIIFMTLYDRGRYVIVYVDDDSREYRDVSDQADPFVDCAATAARKYATDNNIDYNNMRLTWFYSHEADVVLDRDPVKIYGKRRKNRLNESNMEMGRVTDISKLRVWMGAHHYYWQSRATRDTLLEIVSKPFEVALMTGGPEGYTYVSTFNFEGSRFNDLSVSTELRKKFGNQVFEMRFLFLPTSLVELVSQPSKMYGKRRRDRLDEGLVLESLGMSEGLVDHLKDRGVDPERTRFMYDEQSQNVYFFLYNLSGEMVGYQKYNPKAPRHNKNFEYDRYYTYMKQGGDKQMTVYGLETYDITSPYVFVVEGVFDVVKIHNMGEPALANLGGSLSSEERSWYNMLPQKKIVIMDRDKGGEELGAIADYKTFPPEPYKDLGEMTQEEVNTFINSILNKLGF